ncbi:MAG: hypothetical protein E7161_01045 [Firmicutes bacterium]|nr:hypothetical protein [Bacillota bacterium]
MKEKDKLTLFVFIGLIVIILGILVFNIYKTKKLDNVDRRVEYIFNNLTYDNVFNKGSELFLQTIKLLNNSDIWEFERDVNGKIIYYAINNYNQYKKIRNFHIVNTTLNSVEIQKYMNEKNIIKYENNYYIETNNDEELKSNYIGSNIEIKSYDNNYVYFKCINYYCDDYEYNGIIEEIPSCNYTDSESIFTLVLENNNLRVNNLEEIRNIIK